MTARADLPTMAASPRQVPAGSNRKELQMATVDKPAEHDTRAIGWQPGEGETIRNPVGGSLTFKVRAEQTNGALTVVESTAPPGEGPPLHVHANEDEALYTLDGTLRFRMEDEVQTAPAVRIHPQGNTAHLAEHRRRAGTFAGDLYASGGGSGAVLRALRGAPRG